jgi:carbamoylphosphate synthase small subunit
MDNEQELPLSFNELNSVISSELTSMKKMDTALELIEEQLLSIDILNQLSTKDLCTVYELALKRKTMSHSFIFKMLDLGVKTSLLNKMFEIEQDVSGRLIADDTPKSVVQAKEALKRLIDKRIEEEGIQGTVIDENIIDER